jgi:hypothetical protein
MPDVDARRANDNGRKRERAGFLAAVAFVCAASVRDVFLGDLFQRLSPLAVAIVAFASCALIFLPIALAKDRRALRVPSVDHVASSGSTRRRRWRGSRSSMG